MADLTQTAANVGVASLTSPVRVVQYGEAVAQGEPLYRDSDDGKWYVADASDADKDDVGAIALTPGAADETGVVALPNSDVDLGATLTVGLLYYLSPTSPGGKICDESTLGSGHYVTSLGIATTTSSLRFIPQVSGVAKP